MKFGKKIPERNPENLLYVKSQPCMVCGMGPCDPAHIQVRKFGGDGLDNLMSLCRKHHQEQGTIGIRSFVKKYDLPISWENGFPRRTDVK